ncbi:ejaculatory bulb-specific protein 3 [Anabrus simplex]|uniref:ejaculatory bulb-specific protein 3 n=1 Tax=Anabrus simplex TaxID=316456 RepID=UPI0035A30A06
MPSTVLTVAVIALVGVFSSVDAYGDRLDKVDVDEVLRSDRLVNNYIKCLMDDGPCTPDAAELRKIIPDALESDCSECSEKQKTNADKVIHFLIDNKPEQWKGLETKYDPTGEYRKNYEASKNEKEEETTSE